VFGLAMGEQGAGTGSTQRLRLDAGDAWSAAEVAIVANDAVQAEASGVLDDEAILEREIAGFEAVERREDGLLVVDVKPALLDQRSQCLGGLDARMGV
jgi:hypothetical protein